MGNLTPTRDPDSVWARAGELSAVRVPDVADEAVRDLVRAREDAVRERRNARHRLKALLLRNGITYAGKSACTASHLRWLATQKMQCQPEPARAAVGPADRADHTFANSGLKSVRQISYLEGVS